MSLEHEATARALRAAEDERKATLKQVQREAMMLERHPEGEESRGTVIVDGIPLTPPRQRLRGTLTVRW